MADYDVAAFDAVAPSYDAGFTERTLARWLRSAVRRYLGEVLCPHDRVLEVGCGTGEDAVWLAQRGMHVTATDVAPAMLDVARRKAVQAGVDAAITFRHLDLASPDTWAAIDTTVPFDVVFSNFGGLNCVSERRPIAEALATLVRPGGHLVLVLMGPFCPWEIGWHVLHGDLRAATRRWRGGAEAHVGSGAVTRVWYPSPRRLRTEFAPWFRHVSSAGIGVLLPPSYLAHLVDRRPRLFSWLAQCESKLAHIFPWTWLNDHYVSVFERT